jgi:hypothetical protein
MRYSVILMTLLYIRISIEERCIEGKVVFSTQEVLEIAREAKKATSEKIPGRRRRNC